MYSSNHNTINRLSIYYPVINWKKCNAFFPIKDFLNKFFICFTSLTGSSVFLCSHDPQVKLATHLKHFN